ncbi:hypothetical protein [Thalassospira sp. A3_1]|uniref:hypothetical protein n=1 Tax=Thalassospira sp. A3_1 TaxID=2821088 RepID=UPI001ADD38DA|nr:hypothetical protein [Thalassospira sp. A3_1]MBO9506332.1 hypothetical protein [Thalassospira sp. A3_1]
MTLSFLVPLDDLLHKTKAVIDFDFIHDCVAHLYCADNGRPAPRATTWCAMASRSFFS